MIARGWGGTADDLTRVSTVHRGLVQRGRTAPLHPRISVVVPALNEEDNLRQTLPRIPDWVDEVILIDGKSTDRTVAVAKEMLPSIVVATQTGRGKGDATRQGFAVATGDIIVMLDCDGSANPAEIPLFVGALLAGADLAKGSRFAQGGGSTDITWLRSLGNWAFTRITRVLFHSHYTDLCYGYNAFWRDILPRLHLDADGFEIETQLNLRALRAGLRVVEVPSFEASRVFGESHLCTWADGWRVVRTLLTERVRTAGSRATAELPGQWSGSA
jgi:glycosyltransferase involved in cell wall biosynthesis